MPYYLRAIYSNLSWDKTQFPQWLKEDDLPSCVVKDLSADSNKLSLWEITDDKTNLMQVITAIASGRKTLKDNFDYALLPVRYIDSMYFTYSKKKGKTIHERAYSESSAFLRKTFVKTFPLAF